MVYAFAFVIVISTTNVLIKDGDVSAALSNTYRIYFLCGLAFVNELISAKLKFRNMLNGCSALIVPSLP